VSIQSILEELQNRPGTGDVIPIVDPATEELIAEFTDCGAEAVNEAVARAKAAFERECGPNFPDVLGPRSCGESPTSSTSTPTNSLGSTR
jgi:aldehyde dehydrogenase (NAD+)